jgi:hypothetical protein
MSTYLLAGTQLPAPSTQDIEYGYFGQGRKMANGAVVWDLVSAAQKAKFTLKWTLLSSANLSTVKTAYALLDDSSGSYYDHSGASWTVQRDPDSPWLKVTPRPTASGLRYDVELKLYSE